MRQEAARVGEGEVDVKGSDPCQIIINIALVITNPSNRSGHVLPCLVE